MGQGLTGGGYTSQADGMRAAGAAKEHTQLEALLSHIREVSGELTKAVSRATGMATRLMGSEPTPVPDRPAKANSAIEPPLVARLSEACDEAALLVGQLQAQLDRFERL